MTVLLPNSDDLGPNFLVQRDSDGWSVHRLTFQLEGEQFLQQTPQAESFERLPDEAWFELQLRAFVQGELQKGYLQAT
ncbi:hypothetical protein [Deinococcus apachensis]|uniref:hypothetical protein n=1 Tax=Deinococcus apachensis TaxID=309886 RepID=UPI0012F8E891|nr:hypothetical protein [Deinococcus apachensis]